MFRSKPIGWITAGTLFCVAGVALACRLRDCKETTAGANAAACPVAVVEPDDKADSPKPAETAKAEEKKEKDAPKKLPSLLDVEKKPAVGESVTPAAIGTEPKVEVKVKVDSVPIAAPPSPPDIPHPPVDVPTISSPPAEKDIAKASLLPPEAEPIRPVSGNEDKGGVTTAAVPPPPSSPEKEKKAEDKEAHSKSKGETPEPPAEFPRPPAEPGSSAPDKKRDAVPTPQATIPSKDEASSPPPPTSSVVPVTPAVPADGTPTTASPMPSPSPEGVKPSTPGTPLYRVRGKGESLREIANRTLGSGERWPEIYRLNPDLQPELMVPSGKFVLLPAEAKVDAVKCDGPMEGGQAESEHMGPSKPGVTAVRPLPVVRPHRPQMSEKSIAPLTGTYSCQLDNRSLVMPKEVAEQLGKVETMLLTPGPDRCLWLGTQASVARVLDRVEKSSAADHEVQAFRRLYFAQTEKATVNDAGKMMIPEKLAEYAGLGKEVVLVGIDDHFELWDAARWQRYSQQKEPSLKP